jgi:hypothetical protein
MPNREQTVETIEYLKDNKGAGSESIAAEQLKSGGPSLVNALNEMIQQIWIGETQTESWAKIDCKNYCGICLLNKAYKL